MTMFRAILITLLVTFATVSNAGSGNDQFEEPPTRAELIDDFNAMVGWYTVGAVAAKTCNLYLQTAVMVETQDAIETAKLKCRSAYSRWAITTLDMHRETTLELLDDPVVKGLDPEFWIALRDVMDDFDKLMAANRKLTAVLMGEEE